MIKHNKKEEKYVCEECHKKVETTYHFKKRWLCEKCLKKTENNEEKEV